MLYVPVIDWYSVSCLSDWYQHADKSWVGTTLEDGFISFSLTEGKECNPFFEKSVTAMWQGEDAFHLFYKPYSSAVNERCCQVKVANRLLYCSQWRELLNNVLRAAGWSFVNICRMDVAIDFQRFAGGREPLRFIQDYFARPTHSRPSFIRGGSNKFRAFGCKFVAGCSYETLSFGSRESAVQVNLYNKSRELKAHDKPYIREWWHQYGMDDEQHDVWRVEFSCKSDGLSIVDSEGLYRMVGIGDTQSWSCLDTLAASLVAKFFRFYYVSPDDAKANRRVRDLSPVQLFDMESKPALRFISINKCRTSGRTEKLILKTLLRIEDAAQLDADEKRAFDIVYKKFAALWAAKVQVTDGRMSADKLLAACFKELASDDSLRLPGLKTKEAVDREVQKWVDMIVHARTPMYDAFEDVWRSLDVEFEVLRDTLRDMATHAPIFV